MHITPPADDYGLQKLKKADSSAEVKETHKLEPYPRVEALVERHESKEPMIAERRRRERRQRNRRQAEDKVILDTRGEHERRTKGRREDDQTASAEGGASAAHGIDDFI
jgi:hypothetical protein